MFPCESPSSSNFNLCRLWCQPRPSAERQPIPFVICVRTSRYGPVCAFAWALNAFTWVFVHAFVQMCGRCAGPCVSKERVPFKVLWVCVGEGEHSFTLSRWETPLLFLWKAHLHILPSSILFFFLPPGSRTETGRIQPRAAAFRLSTDLKIWTIRTAQYPW